MLQSDFSKIEPAELVVKNMVKYGRVLSSRKPLRVKLRHTALISQLQTPSSSDELSRNRDKCQP
jgi:hypothetical protein